MKLRADICCTPPKANKRLAPDIELARLAKALGHPARVRIVQLLLRRDSCMCGDIVEHLPLAQSTVSQHLKVLKEAGIIYGQTEGPAVCYCVHSEALRRLGELLKTLA
jgi:ArsR family transcriptional regulator, arsenate/arsenite/antimonite-responsive transcriptional repressor